MLSKLCVCSFTARVLTYVLSRDLDMIELKVINTLVFWVMKIFGDI